MKRSLALFISLLMVLYIVPFSQIVSASDNSEIPEDNIEFVYPDEHLAGTETLTAASSFAYGDGSSANPYIIATPEEFAYFNSLCALETNTSSKYFSLANDIDLTVYSNESQTVTLGNRYFSGNFDGNGFTIIMTGDVSTGYLESSKTKGVFGENKGTVKNLNLSFEKLYFGAQYNGTVAGINAGTIENVVVTIATVVMISEYGNGRLQYFGGIVGENSNGVIKDCHFKGLIKSNSRSVYDAAPSQYVGGIAGKGGE
ncbi:MAG: hypothetical protein IJB49_04640, partial [Clostridia bacterium]|nr:hypothetical protein [Clostridia bacterium]